MKLYAHVLLFAAMVAAPEQRYFRYERAISGIPVAAAQSCVPLDVDSFAHASPHLADLRLYRDEVETPYVIRTAAPAQVGSASIGLVNLGVRGKQVSFDASIPEGRYSDLVLGVTAQNFIATVTVFGGETATEGVGTKLGSYTIFDLTNQRLGRSTVLHLPESDFRHLHFQVDGPLTPENLSHLTIDRLPVSQPRYRLVAASSEVTLKGHASVFVLDVPAHVTVDRLVFTAGSLPVMFSRDVHVEVQPMGQRAVSDDSDSAVSPVIATGNLLRLHHTEDGHRIDEERLAIDAPARDFDAPTRWTISVENGDDAPLDTSVRLEMLQRELCFEAAGNAQYVLFYGDSSLPAPRYDYAALFTRQNGGAQANEGPERANPLYKSRPDLRPFTERHPALLWAALLAVILFLGGIAVQSSRRDSGRSPTVE